MSSPQPLTQVLRLRCEWKTYAAVLQVFVDHPLLTLFVVMAVGNLIGSIKIGGFSLGVAAVLFVGLGLATIEPAVKLPSVVYQLGLILFVYTIGLSSGPTFLRSFNRAGLRDNALVLGMIILGVVETIALVSLFHLDAIRAAGMFAGAVTNTPALAAVIDTLPRVAEGEVDLSGPVVGYSLAYPIGVFGAIVAIAIVSKLLRIDHAAEAVAAGVAPTPLEHWTVEVTRPGTLSLALIPGLTGTKVAASRLMHHTEAGVEEEVAMGSLYCSPGDTVTLVGTAEDLAIAADWLGERVSTHLDREGIDFRRIVVSNPKVVGIPLRRLRLRSRKGILITRIRRGDIDMVATPNSTLQLGDRVRVVTRSGTMRIATALLGDSYSRLSHIDIISFTIGISLGLLLGMIPFPLPGGGVLELGLAGGPLVVALILGAMGRTGPLVWTIPFEANLTIRQLGIMLFLAAIGTTAGEGLAQALEDPAILLLIAGGAIVTISLSVFLLLIAHKLFRIPFGQVTGMLAAMQTQPAVLAYANEHTSNELPNIGYATTYPLAMIGKIVAAQILVVALL